MKFASPGEVWINNNSCERSTKTLPNKLHNATLELLNQTITQTDSNVNTDECQISYVSL